MPTGFPAAAVAALILAAFVLAGCGSLGDATRTAGRAVDDVATLVAAPPPTGEPTPTGPSVSIGAPESPDVQAVMASLQALEVAARNAGIEYDRGDWRHWVDSDRDCQDTRAETLIEESLAPVTFATDEGCRVVAGEWVGPWTGEVFKDASDVDIDHHVPLGHAHSAGGWMWDAGRKRAYANDLSNPDSLQVTDRSVNRSKGKKPPDEWRPDERAGWCRYAADWIAVKVQWELTVTNAEVAALGEMLDTCDEPGSWGLDGAKSE